MASKQSKQPEGTPFGSPTDSGNVESAQLAEEGVTGIETRRLLSSYSGDTAGLIRKAPWRFLFGGFGAGILVGMATKFFVPPPQHPAVRVRRRNARTTGGAVSAVTGGHPEEMNGMPPAIFDEFPVYDGSDLDRVHRRGGRLL